jgi:hypothetical protein
LPRSTGPKTHARADRKGAALRARLAGVASALALLLFDGGVHADPNDSESDRAVSPASAPERDPATSARIVLIGRAATDPELALLFGELLERQGVTVEIDRRERFDPNELFGSDEERVIRVFVLLGDSNQARLRFRGLSGERYLLRKVTLSGGLDAVGRELLGQVVESSVLSLLRSTEGMSRKEVVAALEQDDGMDGVDRPPPAPPRAPPQAKRRAPRRTPSAWEIRFGVRYAAAWSGPKLGWSHGPGLAAGARFREGPSFGLELGAERRFAQALSTNALAAALDRTTFHALLEAGLPLSRSQSAFLALGGALELLTTRPTWSAPGTTPAPEKSEWEPGLRAEARYELALGPLLFGVAALLEGSFAKTRYELLQSGRPELLAAPPLFRPGAVVTLGVKP